MSGPDAGGSRVLPAGEHVVGRSPLAAVRCDDPSLEPFHVRLVLPPSGGPPPGGDDSISLGRSATAPDPAPTPVRWCQLAGRRPVTADDLELTIGTSVLRIEPDTTSCSTGARSGGGSGGIVVRRPRVPLAEPTPPVLDPTDVGRPVDDDVTEPTTAALLPAMVTLAVGFGLALVLHQPMLLLMGAVGAVVALVTWLVGRVRRHRRRVQRRRDAARAGVELARATSAHADAVAAVRRAAHPGLPGATDVLRAAPRRLWERRPEHGDAFTVVVGTGPGATDPLVDGAAPIDLADVPTTIELGPGERVAVGGAMADSVVRSLLAQVAITTGPADWCLVVAGDSTGHWTWAADLPHLRRTADGDVVHDDAALVELADSLAAAPTDGRHLLLVTDAVDRLAIRTSGLRRVLHSRPDTGLLVVAGDVVPAVCTTAWLTAADGSVRAGDPGHDVDHTSVTGGRLRLHGLGRTAAAAIARELATWSDPEAPVGDDRRLADDVSLDALWAARGLRPESSSIAERWGAIGVDAAPAAPIGAAAEGVVEVDLVRDGPHGLVAGTTGSGKSELLRTIVLSLATSVPPDQLALVLVDFKGGATFDGLAELPHVAGVVTDLEPRLAERVLRGLRAEVTRREHLLRDLGCPDLTSARARSGAAVVPRLAIVVDEFAALAVEHPHLLHSLVDVARRGRSLGVHLLLATQRPGGVVSEEIRTNTDLRIALRLHEAGEAVDVVGDPSPASIRRNAAGRAVMRLGPGELVPFQTARPSDAGATVREIRAAAARLGLAPAERPWCEPLPELLQTDDPLQLGTLDLPDVQRRAPLSWTPADGHLLVVGSVGSGVTTTLAGLALRRLSSDAELLVIDAVGDPRWDAVAEHPRCAGVARLHDVELVDRLLRRALSAPPPGGRLVVVDGLAALRRDLEPVHRSASHERSESLLLTPPTGVTLIVGNDGLGGLGPAVVSRCARRLVLHLHDPAEASGLGVRAADVPPAIPGRCHDLVAAAEGQLAPWPDAAALLAATGRTPAVDRVSSLPTDVAASALPASWCDDRSWFAPVGLAADDLAVVPLEVPAGEHVLVIGPARSGRSEVLAALRRGWSQARPDGGQVVVSPRHLASAALAPAVADAIDQVHAQVVEGRHVLLVVDDADLVADPGGALAALTSAHHPTLSVVVACRPDSVRSTYAHWAAGLRRHRRGVLMAAVDELDGDLLGVTLPRHLPIAARPGLCWVVGDGVARLAQAARRGEVAGP